MGNVKWKMNSVAAALKFRSVVAKDLCINYSYIMLV